MTEQVEGPEGHPTGISPASRRGAGGLFAAPPAPQASLSLLRSYNCPFKRMILSR
jgi:hypothetical protein